MNRQLRLMSFSLRQFLTVPYFLQLLLLSTFGATALQALAAGAWPVDATLAWTRAGIIGTWNMCIVSAGILNFERYRGTFVYLLNGAVNPLRALAAVVSTASIFGLAALPLAWAFLGAVHLLGRFYGLCSGGCTLSGGSSAAVDLVSGGDLRDCRVLCGDPERYRL